jgi:hypothetical protein
VFTSWQEAIVRFLTQAGAAAGQAADLATYVLAAFEGAIVLSRTARDTSPLRVTAAIVASTIRDSLRPQ